MRFVVTIAIVVVCATASSSATLAEESPDAYEVVTATAVPVLPLPLRAFFEDHLEAIRQSATAHIVSAPTPDAISSEADRHYVKLDVAARGYDAAARRAAARRFPRDRATAIELSKQEGVRHSGSLPWVIRDHYDALVHAFRDKESAGGGPIVHEAGALLHFATDAALPFNTTADRNGAASGHLRWSAGTANRENAFHRTVRHRYHFGLLARLRTRFAYEVRVHPQRYRVLSQPFEAIFDLLLETHSVLDHLLAIDAETITELGVTDAETFAHASDRYYDRLADRAASIMESRLEAAALLSANLIGTAWVRAGSPTLRTVSASNARVNDKATPASQPQDVYVGSRHSTIFHRATCPHAKRIKPDNLVSFERAQEARSAGRTPCKTCKPDGSGDESEPRSQPPNR